MGEHVSVRTNEGFAPSVCCVYEFDSEFMILMHRFLFDSIRVIHALYNSVYVQRRSTPFQNIRKFCGYTDPRPQHAARRRARAWRT